MEARRGVGGAGGSSPPAGYLGLMLWHLPLDCSTGAGGALHWPREAPIRALKRRIATEGRNLGNGILKVDDFFASGATILGLARLAEAAGARMVGIGTLIEKAFESGRASLAELGVNGCALHGGRSDRAGGVAASGRPVVGRREGGMTDSVRTTAGAPPHRGRPGAPAATRRGRGRAPAALLLAPWLILAAACAATSAPMTLARRSLPHRGPTEALALVMEAADAALLDLVGAEAPGEGRTGTLVYLDPPSGAALVVAVAPAATGSEVSIYAFRPGMGSLPSGSGEADASVVCVPCAEADRVLADEVLDRGRLPLETRRAARRLAEGLDELGAGD